jgi:hypothetical protein
MMQIKRSPVNLLLCALALTSCDRTENIYMFKGQEPESIGDEGENYRPKNGYVSTPKMAAEIAEILAKNVYGAAEIEKQKPYLVSKQGRQWIIRGSFPQNPAMKGGSFEVRLSAADGRVLRMIHGE